MNRTAAPWGFRAGVVLMAFLAAHAAPRGNGLPGQQGASALPLRLKALAVDTLAPAPPVLGSANFDLVQVVIERWSTADETARLAGAMREGDQQVIGVLESIKPRVGYVRYLREDEVMFPLAYAEQSQGPDGTGRIVIMTAMQAYPQARESAIKVIEMRFGADGVGEGRIAAATLGGASGEWPFLALSDYTTARRCLKMIRRE